MATGAGPENALYHVLRERGASVETIGDAVAPRTTYEAVYEGHRQARKLEGGPRAVPLNDPDGVDAAGQRAEREAAVAAEPRRAERVGDGGRRVADEQRRLQRERHPLDERGARASTRVGVAEVEPQPLEPRRRAGGRRRAPAATSARNASSVSGLRADRAQDVEAMTLPEPSQIELSGASR